MALFAQLDSRNAVIGIRDLASRPDPTASKGFRWLPLEVTPAPTLSAIETATKSFDVRVDKVVEVWTIERIALPMQIAAVKGEARRRILALYPDWKQANLTARGVELLRKGEPNWSAEELTEADAIHGIWDWVKEVRAASDVLEATDPIPTNFADDRHWPE